MNRTELTAAAERIQRNIIVASEGSPNAKEQAERTLLADGAAIAVGIGCALLDIRDNLARIADAHEMIANHGIAFNAPSGQRVTQS